MVSLFPGRLNSLLSGTGFLLLDRLYLVTLGDLNVVRGVGVSEFHRIVPDVHRRLSDFIHAIVVHRRDEAIRGWRKWIREDPLGASPKGGSSRFGSPAPFLQCEPHLTSGGSGVLSDPARIDEEFRKAWLPLEEFDFEIEEWLPLLP